MIHFKARWISVTAPATGARIGCGEPARRDCRSPTLLSNCDNRPRNAQSLRAVRQWGEKIAVVIEFMHPEN